MLFNLLHKLRLKIDKIIYLGIARKSLFENVRQLLYKSIHSNHDVFLSATSSLKI